MSRASNRNNVVAGAFLIGAMALAVAVSFILGEYKDKLFADRASYTVEFPLDVGAEGVKPGAEVTLGGQKVGEVKGVGPAEAETGETIIRVEIEVDSAVTLGAGVRAELVTPLFGQLSAINFSALGDADEAIAEGGTIPGVLMPGMLKKIGLDPNTIANIGEAVESAKRVAARIDAMLEENGEITGIITSVQATATNVEDVTASVRESLPGWETRIGSILGNVDHASAELGPLLINANTLLGRADTLIKVNSPDLRRVVQDVRSITDRARHETMDQVETALDEGVGALASAREIGDEINVFLDQEVPRLRRSIENVRLMTEEGRAAAAELRAQPWRLSQQPSAGDLENEPFYNAARAYARAAADLQTVSSALESVVIQAGSTGAGAALVDPARVRALTVAVEDALERYQLAEQRLFDHIGQSTR